MTLPPMPYSGGKQKVAPKIADLLPAHTHYVEPFAGALSVLLAKPPSPIETVNDLNGDIMTFWRVLRDQPEDLQRICSLTPHSRAERRNATFDDSISDLERARRVWVLLTQSRAAVLRSSSGWRFCHGGNRMSLAAYLDGYVERIRPAAERLKRVSLECRPAADVIDAYGAQADALLYLDPPYLGETRNRTDQYVHEMATVDEHAALLEQLLGCAAAVVVSGYPHPLYDTTLAGWHRYQFVARAASGQPRVEVVWMNRAPQPSLLDEEIA